jgi:hypothetical protein
MPKLDKNTPVGKGIRTGLQSIVGFITGLGLAIWGVPGVSEVAVAFILDNGVELALTFGISSGLVSFIQNYFGK